MAATAEARLKELGIELPAPAAPAANYVPFVHMEKLLFVSGQLPLIAGGPAYNGKLGKDYSVEDGQSAARACAINILAQAKAALGDLERIKRCVRLNGFVNAVPEFTDHPEVINGASNLIADALGDRGRHSRIAVGCGSLPRNVPVEVDAVFITD
ncbi:MAG: RidA family protein [Hyphomicrobiales bacterium]